MADILVVDDDQSIAKAFRAFLEEDRHQVRVASGAADGLRQIVERRPDLVIMDVRMPGVDGLQALNEIRGRFPNLHVVIMTAYGTSQTSIEAIRSGAFDYVTKPLDLDDLRTVINKALEAQHITAVADASPDTAPADALVNLVGKAPAMLDIYKTIARLSTNDVAALISGERGTGKQLVAETIHDNSARREEPFAAIDCAALTDSAVAEIFSGDAGTILLVDIEAMPVLVQARLARAMSASGRTAAAAAVRLNARVLGSTTADLAEETRRGNFNRELFDALAVIRIHLPPLRERRGDIPSLVGHLIQRFNAELNRSIKGVDAQVTRLLKEHSWPGNVRQLQTVIKRACILARGDVITADDLGDSLSPTRLPVRPPADADLRTAVTKALQDRLKTLEPASSAFHDIVDLVEGTLVQEALKLTNGNQVKASEMLGVNRATLRKKMP